MAKQISFYAQAASIRPLGMNNFVIDADATDRFQIAEQINDHSNGAAVVAHMICQQKDLASVIEHLNEKGLEDLKRAIADFEKGERS